MREIALVAIVAGAVCVGVLIGIIASASRQRPWERIAFQAMAYAYEANRVAQAYRLQVEELLSRQAA